MTPQDPYFSKWSWSHIRTHDWISGSDAGIQDTLITHCLSQLSTLAEHPCERQEQPVSFTPRRPSVLPHRSSYTHSWSFTYCDSQFSEEKLFPQTTSSGKMGLVFLSSKPTLYVSHLSWYVTNKIPHGRQWSKLACYWLCVKVVLALVCTLPYAI